MTTFSSYSWSEEKKHYNPRKPFLAQQSVPAISLFFGKLEKFPPNPVVLLTVPPPKNTDCLLPSLKEEEVRIQSRNNNETELLETFINRLTFSDKQLLQLEQSIKNQELNVALTKAWANHSIAFSYPSMPGKVQWNPKLLSSIKLTKQESLDQVDAIKWGRDNKNKARESFFHEIVLNHKHLKFSSCGLRPISTAPILTAFADNWLVWMHVLSKFFF